MARKFVTLAVDVETSVWTSRFLLFRIGSIESQSGSYRNLQTTLLCSIPAKFYTCATR